MPFAIEAFLKNNQSVQCRASRSFRKEKWPWYIKPIAKKKNGPKFKFT
jgi:hypothetical protein